MEVEKVSSEVRRVAKEFNNFYFKLSIGLGEVVPLKVEGETVGLLLESVIEELRNYPDVFKVTQQSVTFNENIKDYKERSEKVKNILDLMRKGGRFSTLNGWRNECFEVRGSSGSSMFEMERSATCLFGVRQFGVHINGYVIHPEKGLCIWLQKRANNKQTWPGKMDNMVGGGLSVGYSVFETALKEASEEAGISVELLDSLVPSGSVSFYFQSERGLFPNTEFVFDLQLPIDFIPINQDGEEALSIVVSPDFKTTSCPVTLDFMVRHGIINSQNECGMCELVELLHVPLTQLYKTLFT